MAYTLTCHACGNRVQLFDIDVKRRKGTVRCTRCGARISYDLDSRKVQQSGYWAVTEPAFDPRAKERLMKQIGRQEMRERGTTPAPTAAETARMQDFAANPFSAKAGFAKFDLKTGQIIGDETPLPAPLSHQKNADGIVFRTVDRSHQKRTLHAARDSLHSSPRKPSPLGKVPAEQADRDTNGWHRK